jgi:hypothetical protein
MYIQDSERDVHLVLLPGINPIHAFNVDYFLSRAILRADLAAETYECGLEFQTRTFIPYPTLPLYHQ